MTAAIAPPDVHYGGQYLSDRAARMMIVAVDALAAKVIREGGCLNPELVGIRNSMARGLTRADIRVDASTEVGSVPSALALNTNAVVDPTAAAKQLGITTDAVRWACRKGRLDATKQNGCWWITTASIEQYAKGNQ